MIPIKYNLRNLRVRWVTTVMTVLGTGLVVWSSCLLFGLVDGLQYSLTVSGEPLDLIILRKGSSQETNSGFDTTKADTLKTLSGVARNDQGVPLVAAELLNIPVAERMDGSRANVIVRGVEPVSRELRPSFKIVQGRDLEPGRGECIVSRNMSGRFKNTRVGDVFKAGEKEAYQVVGVFTAGGSSAESEIWVDRLDLAANTGRENSVSSVQIRAASANYLEELIGKIRDDPQFKLDAERETAFFAKQTSAGNFLKFSGALIAVLLSIGAMFAAANTMYAAVSARTREIGTMRALGFSRSDILISFLTESVILCCLGGAVGMIATIPLTALTFGTINNFSEVTFSFRFGPLVLAVAFIMTLGMGVFGGLFPAVRAVKLDVISALREL